MSFYPNNITDLNDSNYFLTNDTNKHFLVDIKKNQTLPLNFFDTKKNVLLNLLAKTVKSIDTSSSFIISRAHIIQPNILCIIICKLTNQKTIKFTIEHRDIFDNLKNINQYDFELKYCWKNCVSHNDKNIECSNQQGNRVAYPSVVIEKISDSNMYCFYVRPDMELQKAETFIIDLKTFKKKSFDNLLPYDNNANVCSKTNKIIMQNMNKIIIYDYVDDQEKSYDCKRSEVMLTAINNSNCSPDKFLGHRLYIPEINSTHVKIINLCTQDKLKSISSDYVFSIEYEQTSIVISCEHDYHTYTKHIQSGYIDKYIESDEILYKIISKAINHEDLLSTLNFEKTDDSIYLTIDIDLSSIYKKHTLLFVLTKKPTDEIELLKRRLSDLEKHLNT